MNSQEQLDSRPVTRSIAGNKWSDIPVSEIGSWVPQHHVTVVIPYYERQEKLNLTLAALSKQTYPKQLTEVIIVDDGSSTPPIASNFSSELNIKIFIQSRDGFGAGRARNLGAQKAAGEILCFLDCDMIPEQQFLEAHARWHHAASYAAVVGFRFHVDFQGIQSDKLASAIESNSLTALLAGRNIAKPEWLEDHMRRSDMLLDARDDYFRVMSGGNLSMRKDIFAEAGGFDESFNRWGGEDNELAFRVMQCGVVVVPDRLAVCWHQGEGQEPSLEEQKSLRLHRPKMAQLIAELGYRKPEPGCSYTVPYVVVTVDGSDLTAEIISKSVNSILGSEFHDLIVNIRLPENADESDWLTNRYECDQRVCLLENQHIPIKQQRFAALNIEIPGNVLFHSETLNQVISNVKASGVGILHGTLPKTAPSVGKLTTTLTRAVNRAKRSAGTREELELILSQQFGERWVSANALGLGIIFSTGEVLEPADPEGKAMPASGSLSQQLENAQITINAINNRRVVRMTDAIVKIKSVRSFRQFLSACKAVLQALTKTPV